MIGERELVSSPEYWMETLQNELFRQLDDYRIEHGYNRKQLAEHLGFSKGYVSRLLNGDFNHSAKKLIELSLKIGKAPIFEFKDMDTYLASSEVLNVIEPNKSGDINSMKWRELKSLNQNAFPSIVRGDSIDALVESIVKKPEVASDSPNKSEWEGGTAPSLKIVYPQAA